MSPHTSIPHMDMGEFSIPHFTLYANAPYKSILCVKPHTINLHNAGRFQGSGGHHHIHLIKDVWLLKYNEGYEADATSINTHGVLYQPSPPPPSFPHFTPMYHETYFRYIDNLFPSFIHSLSRTVLVLNILMKFCCLELIV